MLLLLMFFITILACKFLLFCTFATDKSCLTSKHMHIAEIRTVAKSLPPLRWNTHKSLILSYSADFSVIFTEKKEFYSRKVSLMTKIGNKNRLLCGFTFKTSYNSSQKYWNVSGISHIHSRKLTQMTKIRNMFNILVLFNENEHGCNNEQT